MIRAVVIAVAAVVAVAAGAAAQEKTGMVGNWIVRTERDRFSDRRRAIARLGQGAKWMEIRCQTEVGMPPWLTIRLSGNFARGGLFNVKFRVDEKPVIDWKAFGENNRFVEISRPQRLVKQMLGGKEAAFHIASPSDAVDAVYPLGPVERALAPVLKVCPLE